MNTTKFSDLGIAPNTKGMEGDKIKIERVFNREIVVKSFAIEPSKFPQPGRENRLKLEFEMLGTKHITFTTSLVLTDQIKRVLPEKFPFTTKIVKDQSDRFIFT